MKKTLVLTVMFVLPIVVYLFFASGVNTFGKLPILTEQIDESLLLEEDVAFTDNITILGFLGDDIANKKGNAFNLNQKIYKRFHEFKDFQFVMVVPEGNSEAVALLKSELANLADIGKWKFIYLSPVAIQSLFNTLKTDTKLGKDLASPYVFIIDKDRNLRGRTEDKDVGTKYGFNTNSVADLNNKMVDDVKIILAEYRLALKENNVKRSK